MSAAEQLLLPGLLLTAPEPGTGGPRRITLAPTAPDAALVRAALPAPAGPRAVGGSPPAIDDAASLRRLEYVVVDTETTGGSALRGHRVTEVAILRVAHDGTVLEEFTTLVNPERPIPAFISSLTNITADMVRGAPRFQEIAPEVARLLQGRVFVAHNAAFDWRFLSWELEHATGCPPAARLLCTVRLARKVVPEIASRSLDALCYFFDLQNDARHRAYGDARVTATLLARLLARVAEREIVSWGELQALIGRRKPRAPRRRNATPSSMDPSEVPAQ